MNPVAAALVGVAYLIGSFSFAVILVRLRTGKDIRTEGSGNAGATNVLRSHGKALGLAVAALDIAKGAAAVLLVRQFTADPRYAAAAGFAAILGHVFPIFYGFRGGKGVATAVGAFLVLAPLATLVCVGIFVVVIAVTRYVSLGSILAIVLLPPVAAWLGRGSSPIGDPVAVSATLSPVVVAAAATAVLVIFKHRENLKRLAAGTERKMGQK